MNIKALSPLAILAALGTASAASALTITVESGGNLAAFSYDYDVATRTINIYETWSAATSTSVVLKLSDWNYGNESWKVNKYLTNHTGGSWNSFAHELLNANGQSSNDTDGLSFAQLGDPLRPRGSDSFAEIYIDELGARDYLLFEDGSVADGATAWFTYGLTARDPDNVNPFYLRQSETLNAIPEPATWAMLILGFGFVGASLRRRRTNTVSA